MPSTLSVAELTSWIACGAPVVEPGRCVVVDLDAVPTRAPATLHSGVRAVVVGTTRGDETADHPGAGLCDVVVRADGMALDAIAATVAAQPIAATALVVLLRGAAHRSIDDGLMAESAVYSSLQAGPEFAAWLASRPRRRRPTEGEPVVIQREGSTLTITLTRPHVHNALNTVMRDALVEAFRLPALDHSITQVHWRGDGPSFCAGGDLQEFGTLPDPATAHLLRLQQSAGRAIAGVADRVTAHLHGACTGSGIELPAFAARVVANPTTTISLPEVSLGLVPGAGGTVSLPRRIGRHRTAWLALTGESIDARMALAWGLVDVVEG